MFICLLFIEDIATTGRKEFAEQFFIYGFMSMMGLIVLFMLFDGIVAPIYGKIKAYKQGKVEKKKEKEKI
jgi:hypothetical protein